MLSKTIHSASKSELLFVILLALTGIFATASLWVSTPYGLGLVNDSAAYIGGANNLVSGNGYSRLSGGGEIRPITHFPPLFSILLAGFRLLGVDTIQAAHITILGLFGLNTVLVGVSIRQLTHSKLFALIGAFLFGANVLFLQIHSFAMSEPLFLFLSLLSLIFFSGYLHQRKIAWLVAAGVLMGLATLTRFAGLALIVTGLLVLVLQWSGWKKFTREAGVFTTSWLPFVLGWSIRNQVVAGTSTNRQVNLHPPSSEVILEGISRFWAWLLPGRIEVFLQNHFWLSGMLLTIAGLFILLTVVYAWLQFKQRKSNTLSYGISAPTWFLHGLYIFVYLASIVGTITLLDATTSFENRILAPAITSFLIWMVALWYFIWQKRSRILKIGVVLVILFFAIRFYTNGRSAIEGLRYDGQGYSTRIWREAEAVQAVRELPEDLVLYTNRPNIIYLLTGRGAYIIPSPVDPVVMQERPEYMANLNKMKQEIQEGKAALVLFSTSQPLTPEEHLWYEELKRGLPVISYYYEGDIYGTVNK